jgi:hypothetical protein
MKIILHTLAALCLCAPALRSNEIIILSTKASYNGQYYIEENPADDPFGNNAGGVTAPTGYPASSYKGSNTGYLIIDLTDAKVVEVSYSTIPGDPGDPASKVMTFSTSPAPLDDYFGDSQRIKTPNSFLWHSLDGTEFELESEDPNDPLLTIPGEDTNEDGDIDYFSTTFRAEFLNGIGTPLVSGTLALPNVPRKITGTANSTYVDDGDQDTFGNGLPPYREFTKEITTSTFLLDTPVTIASNTTSIASTADLFGNTDSRASATLMNAMQRVRNALFAKGYRLGAPLNPANF